MPNAMNSVHIFVFLCCLVSAGLTLPIGPILSYQDSFGQYSFGYTAPGSARSEIRTVDGKTHGAYSYIDASGVLQSARYTADGENGFHVTATNLPQAPLLVEKSKDASSAQIDDSKTQEMPQEEQKIVAKNVPTEEPTELQEKTVNADEKKESKPREEETKTEATTETTKDEEKAKEKVEVKAEEKVEEKAEEKVAEKAEEKVAEKAEEKVEEKAEEKVEEKAEEKVEQKVESVKTSTEKPQAESGPNENSETPKESSSESILKILRQPTIPVFRISHENLSILQEPTIVQGSSITPAGTILKSGETVEDKIEPVKSKEPKEEELKSEEQEESIDSSEEIIAPLHILPLHSAYPTFVRYTSLPALHYVVL